MEPFIDHIEITVRDLSTAIPFYDRLLPLVGFDLRNRSEAIIERHEKHVVSYEHPLLGFAITSPLGAFASEPINRRKPGALHHLAFRARSRADVDRLHLELQAIGATIVSPPRNTRNTCRRLLRSLFQGSRGHQVRDRKHRPQRSYTCVKSEDDVVSGQREGKRGCFARMSVTGYRD